MPLAVPNPVINDALTVAPAVVYSPTVPLHAFTTNKWPPEIAAATGQFNPVISDALTTRPSNPYSPMVPLFPFATNKSWAWRVAAKLHASTRPIPMAVPLTFIILHLQRLRSKSACDHRRQWSKTTYRGGMACCFMLYGLGETNSSAGPLITIRVHYVSIKTRRARERIRERERRGIGANVRPFHQVGGRLDDGAVIG